MKRPVLSIIIPVYNAEDSITNIVESIVSQKFTDWELILVNDKSTDDSIGAIRDLAKYDSRIVVVNRRSNGGASAARNSGINKAHGQYLMFFDADDDIKPSLITRMLKAMQPSASGLACCGAVYNTYSGADLVSSTEVGVDPLPHHIKGESWTTYITKLLGIDGRLYQIWNKIYRTDIIRKHGIRFIEGLNFGEDLLFNLDYFTYIDHIKFINRPLYIYNMDISGGTYSKSSLVWQNRLVNYQHLIDFTKASTDSNLNDYLSWIRYNWFYSYALAVASSSRSDAQKTDLLRIACQSGFLGLTARREVIGTKKYLVQKVVYYTSQNPQTFRRLIQFSVWLKNGNLTGAIWRKLRNRLWGAKIILWNN